MIRTGSPFKFHVDSLASGYVTAYGPGLIYGVCGEPGNFTISTKGAGAGGLSMAVEGPSKAEISCHDNKDGTVSVSYLPTAPGEYKISVKFGDKHIRGSPYLAKITGESDCSFFSIGLRIMAFIMMILLLSIGDFSDSIGLCNDGARGGFDLYNDDYLSLVFFIVFRSIVDVGNGLNCDRLTIVSWRLYRYELVKSTESN